MLTFWTVDLNCSLPLPSEVGKLNKKNLFLPPRYPQSWESESRSSIPTLLLLPLQAHLNVHLHPAGTWCHPGPTAVLLKTLSSKRWLLPRASTHIRLWFEVAAALWWYKLKSVCAKCERTHDSLCWNKSYFSSLPQSRAVVLFCLDVP